jgi:hypothetical protein
MDRNEVLDYIRKSIYGAIISDKAGVIDLLRGNGVLVNDNVDNKTLYAMVLTAITKSAAFKNALVGYLHSKQGYTSADGGFSSWQMSVGKRWLGIDDSQNEQNLINALQTGIDTLKQEIDANGANGLQNELNNAAIVPQQTTQPQNRKTDYKSLLIAATILGVGIYLYNDYSKSR